MIPQREGPDGVRDRDVRQILTAAEIGLRWGDNVGPVVRLRYLASRAPFDLEMRVTERPAAVLCLAAKNRSDDTTESGCRVTWTTRAGRLRITAIDVSDTADEYDVTLGVVKG